MSSSHTGPSGTSAPSASTGSSGSSGSTGPFRPSQPVSTYSYSGVATATLNTLTNAVNPDTSKTLTDLSTNNYPTGAINASSPNATNQTIFKNQPMSWWLSGLQSGAINYFPLSNYVNWSYTDASKNVYHIDVVVSKAIIPNQTKNVTTDNTTHVTTITFVDKFGMSRIDTRKMM